MRDVPQHDVPRGGRSGFVRVEGRQVHYLEWGRGGAPAVVCLHGAGQTAYVYEPLGAALRERYRVLAIDLPRHGDSDSVSGHGPPAYAPTLPPLLAEFGIERAVWVGGSGGGITALVLSALQPTAVEGLALIDVGLHPEGTGYERIIDFLTRHESFGSLEEAAEAIHGHSPRGRPPNPARLTRSLRQRPDGRWVWKHDLARSLRERPEDSQQQMQAEIRRVAPRLKCPVLLMRGSESDVLTEAGARALAELIPGSELAVIERAGHQAAAENPATLVSILSGWMERIGW